jgi:hypothetical protein
MYKTIAAVIVSAFAFGATTSFAADVAKKSEELTVEQRAEMRERAARLKAQGAQPPLQQEKTEKKADKAKTSAVRPAHKIKHTSTATLHNAKHSVTHKHKTKKSAKRGGRKAHRKA